MPSFFYTFFISRSDDSKFDFLRFYLRKLSVKNGIYKFPCVVFTRLIYVLRILPGDGVQNLDTGMTNVAVMV